MKVRELIEQLKRQDPEATVFTYAYEYGGRASKVTTNADDDLYFASDPAHGSPDEPEYYVPNYVYIVGR